MQRHALEIPKDRKNRYEFDAPQFTDFTQPIYQKLRRLIERTLYPNYNNLSSEIDDVDFSHNNDSFGDALLKLGGDRYLDDSWFDYHHAEHEPSSPPSPPEPLLSPLKNLNCTTCSESSPLKMSNPLKLTQSQGRSDKTPQRRLFSSPKSQAKRVCSPENSLNQNGFIFKENLTKNDYKGDARTSPFINYSQRRLFGSENYRSSLTLSSSRTETSTNISTESSISKNMKFPPSSVKDVIIPPSYGNSPLLQRANLIRAVGLKSRPQRVAVQSPTDNPDLISKTNFQIIHNHQQLLDVHELNLPIQEIDLEHEIKKSVTASPDPKLMKMNVATPVYRDWLQSPASIVHIDHFDKDSQNQTLLKLISTNQGAVSRNETNNVASKMAKFLNSPLRIRAIALGRTAALHSSACRLGSLDFQPKSSSSVERAITDSFVRFGDFSNSNDPPSSEKMYTDSKSFIYTKPAVKHESAFLSKNLDWPESPTAHRRNFHFSDHFPQIPTSPPSHQSIIDESFNYNFLPINGIPKTPICNYLSNFENDENCHSDSTSTPMAPPKLTSETLYALQFPPSGEHSRTTDYNFKDLLSPRSKTLHEPITHPSFDHHFNYKENIHSALHTTGQQTPHFESAKSMLDNLDATGGTPSSLHVLKKRRFARKDTVKPVKIDDIKKLLEEHNQRIRPTFKQQQTRSNGHHHSGKLDLAPNRRR